MIPFLWAAFRLMRPVNMLVGVVAFGLGMAIGKVELSWGSLGIALGVVALSYAFANVDNDRLDLKVDRWAHPDRPLVRKEITSRQALGLEVCLGCMSLLGSMVLGWETAGFVGGMLGIAMLYNRWGKHLPLVGNLMVATTASGVFPFLMILAGTVVVPLVAVWGMAFAFHLTREIVKDCADVEGDKVVGSRTLSLVWGRRKALLVALGVHGLLMVGLVVTYRLEVFSSLFFLLLTVVGYGGGALAVLVRVWKDPERCGWGGRMLKILLIPAFLGILGG